MTTPNLIEETVKAVHDPVTRSPKQIVGELEGVRQTTVVEDHSGEALPLPAQACEGVLALGCGSSDEPCDDGSTGPHARKRVPLCGCHHPKCSAPALTSTPTAAHSPTQTRKQNTHTHHEW